MTPDTEVNLTPWGKMAAFLSRGNVDSGAVSGDQSIGPTGPWHQSHRAGAGRLAQHGTQVPAQRKRVAPVPAAGAPPLQVGSLQSLSAATHRGGTSALDSGHGAAARAS